MQAQEQIAKEKEAEKGESEKVDKAKSDMERLKKIYQVINGASAITVVGVIITFLVMNAQLILGNLMKIKFVPPLGKIEIMIIIFLDFLIIALISIIIVLIAAVLDIIDAIDVLNLVI